MRSLIKTGILSFGTSGKIFHAPFVKAHPGFEFSAVVERTDKKAHLYYPNIKSYDSVDELMQDGGIDLVIVNTPNATHYEFALKALRNNKHVLVEKAFTITSMEARSLFNEAKKVQRLVLPYQNRRYDGDFLSVRKIIESGKLGRLVEVHFHFDRYRYDIGPKAKEKPGLGSGILYDLGPHLIDSAIAIFGTPLRWSKTLGQFRPDTRVDDVVHLQLSYADGLQVFLHASVLVADVQPAFVMHGTKGSYIKKRVNIQEEQLLEGKSPDDPDYGIEPEGNEGKLTVVDADGGVHTEKIIAGKGDYKKVFEDVYNAIINRVPYPVSEKEIIKQLEILEG